MHNMNILDVFYDVESVYLVSIYFYLLQFQSLLYSSTHPWIQCALLLFLYSYFYHALSLAPQFQIYFIFDFYLENCTYTSPSRRVFRVLARTVSMKMTYARTFDKEYRGKWPFNGNLEERKRERHTLHELLSSAGFGLSLWNLFELFTRARMPQDAAIILRNASVTPTIPRVMSSTIHSQMARNPILSLPCTNLTLCVHVGKFIGATFPPANTRFYEGIFARDEAKNDGTRISWPFVFNVFPFNEN